MAKLQSEIDTDEIWQGDYDEPGTSFEELVRHAVGKEVRVEMQSKFAGEAFETTSKNIALECIYQVNRKLRDLVNEDIVMQDRWGEPKFIGSVEDYIKKQIDEKLLKPVNSEGKPLDGCQLGHNKETWIEWTVNKWIDKELKNVKAHVVGAVNDYCKKSIDKTLRDFQKNTLNGLIMKKLESVGVE